MENYYNYFSNANQAITKDLKFLLVNRDLIFFNRLADLNYYILIIFVSFPITFQLPVFILFLLKYCECRSGL